MKVTMVFELPEETEEYHEARCGPIYRSTLRTLDDHLRGMLKYQDHPEPVRALCQELRDILREECQGAMQDEEI